LLLAHRELRRYPARFDVVAIAAAPEYKINWIRNAFTV
jgi:Holliday junction resolvase-like predicted endonuclease